MCVFLLSRFFLNDPATPEIYTRTYTLSLRDALPISLTGYNHWHQARATLNDSTPIPTVTEKDSSRTRQVNIGIGEEDRVAISEGLSRLLADTYTPYLTSHNFHWDVTGPMFNSLHMMFMTQYTELW